MLSVMEQVLAVTTLGLSFLLLIAVVPRTGKSIPNEDRMAEDLMDAENEVASLEATHCNLLREAGKATEARKRMAEEIRSLKEQLDSRECAVSEAETEAASRIARLERALVNMSKQNAREIGMAREQLRSRLSSFAEIFASMSRDHSIQEITSPSLRYNLTVAEEAESLVSTYAPEQ